MLLVTGAAGFIGSNVLAALNAQGRDDIVVVDDLTDGRKCLNLVGKRFADYRDFHELQNYVDDDMPRLPKLSGIIHLGANSTTTDWNGRQMVENNYTFAKRMLRLAKHRDCPFIYASSASVYGDGTRGFRELPENETPKSPYAVSKWMFDQYVRRQWSEKKLRIPVIGMRYFNVYGPGEAHKDAMASFVYKCLRAAKDGKHVEVFEGSEGISRDFIYVRDAAMLTLKFFDTRWSGIYNVGTGTAVSMLDVAQMIVDEYPGATLSVIPFPATLKPGYQAYTKADITRLVVDLPGISTAWFTPIRGGIQQYQKEYFK